MKHTLFPIKTSTHCVMAMSTACLLCHCLCVKHRLWLIVMCSYGPMSPCAASSSSTSLSSQGHLGLPFNITYMRQPVPCLLLSLPQGPFVALGQWEEPVWQPRKLVEAHVVRGQDGKRLTMVNVVSTVDVQCEQTRDVMLQVGCKVVRHGQHVVTPGR
jgi:hypothetical protein